MSLNIYMLVGVATGIIGRLTMMALRKREERDAELLTLADKERYKPQQGAVAFDIAAIPTSGEAVLLQQPIKTLADLLDSESKSGQSAVPATLPSASAKAGLLQSIHPLRRPF